MEQLLLTKLYLLPPDYKLVPRPRLVEQLNQVQHLKLTVFSAPAGFGITTLTAQSLHKITEPAAWFSLEESDNV